MKRGLRITGTVKDFDRIIDLPKLKAHGRMLFSDALQNLYGLVAGKVRTNHSLFPTFLDDISFSFPTIIRSVLRHVREKCRKGHVHE